MLRARLLEQACALNLLVCHRGVQGARAECLSFALSEKNFAISE